MDEVRIESEIGRTLLSRAIESAVKKKTKHAINVDINKINITLDGEKTHISLSADANIDTRDIFKLFTY